MSSSEQLFERAKKHIPGGVNSPVRAFKAVGGTPIFIEGSEGPYVFDCEGKRYIDYVLSWGPMLMGHNHPAVREACVFAHRATRMGEVAHAQARPLEHRELGAGLALDRDLACVGLDQPDGHPLL